MAYGSFPQIPVFNGTKLLIGSAQFSRRLLRRSPRFFSPSSKVFNRPAEDAYNENVAQHTCAGPWLPMIGPWLAHDWPWYAMMALYKLCSFEETPALSATVLRSQKITQTRLLDLKSHWRCSFSGGIIEIIVLWIWPALDSRLHILRFRHVSPGSPLIFAKNAKKRSKVRFVNGSNTYKIWYKINKKWLLSIAKEAMVGAPSHPSTLDIPGYPWIAPKATFTPMSSICFTRSECM